ncbi:MAG: hypothetical protein KKC46_09390 [Proteobacteria bacterium]|nr:hypothetical protein [Pseudomonadota bacterium]
MINKALLIRRRHVRRLKPPTYRPKLKAIASRIMDQIADQKQTRVQEYIDYD